MTLGRQVGLATAAFAVVCVVDLAAVKLTRVEPEPDFVPALVAPRGGWVDFPVFWAGWRMAVGGANPYDPASYGRILDVPDRPWVMAPAPWALLWVGPLAIFDLDPAFQAWRVLGFVLLVGGVFLAWPLFRVRRPGRLGLLVALIFTPAFFCIFVGQLALILAVAVVIALRLARQGAAFLAGVCFSIVLVKPHLLYLVLAFLLVRSLVDRDVRRMTFGVLAGLAGQVLVISLVRPPIVGEWVIWLWSGSAPDYLAPPTLPSLLRLGVFLTTGSAPSWPWVVVPALFLAGLGALAARRNLGLSAEAWILVLIPLSLLTTPHALVYDQSLLLVCHVAMVTDARPDLGVARASALLGVQLAYLAALLWGPTEHFWHAWYPALVAVALVRRRVRLPRRSATARA